MIFFFFSSRRRHTRYIGDWSSDVCSSDLIAGGVTARAVAIEVADRHVIAGRADQGDVDEGPDRGTVTGQTPAHTLVRAGDGIQRIVARGGVALCARRRGRNMVRGLGGAGHIAGKGRRRRVAAVAVAARWMVLVRRGG